MMINNDDEMHAISLFPTFRNVGISLDLKWNHQDRSTVTTIQCRKYVLLISYTRDGVPVTEDSKVRRVLYRRSRRPSVLSPPQA